jgi:hypothetical protein
MKGTRHMNRLFSLLMTMAFVALSGQALAAPVGPNNAAYVSTKNATTTVLGSGGVFTGEADHVAGFAQINCMSKSSHASSVNGFSMEFSTDGTNWDRKKTVTTVAAESQAHTLSVIAEYFRVVYTNSASTQTYFRLECIFNTAQSKPLTTSADEQINDFSDVILVRTTGDHDVDIARGLVANHELVRKFGHNPIVADATVEAVWSAGADYLGFIAAAVDIEVLSSSADDDTDGGGSNNGASLVTVYGLDEDFLEISETFIMNGTTAVATITETSWIRVNRVEVTESRTARSSAPSTTGANVGLITVRASTDTPILASIEIQAGQSEMAIYTVPAGKTAFLRRVEVNVSIQTNKTATVTMWHRPDASDVSTPFKGKRVVQVWEDIAGEETADYASSVSFTEKSDVWFSTFASGSATALVDVQFEMHVVPNAQLPSAP